MGVQSYGPRGFRYSRLSPLGCSGPPPAERGVQQLNTYGFGGVAMDLREERRIETADGRRAWTAGTIDAPSTWYFPLPDDLLADLDARIAALREERRPLPEVRLDGAQRRHWRAALAPAWEALERGRGFVVLTGLDPGRYSRDEQTAAYWLIGQGLGKPFAQNVQGTLLYDVRDEGYEVAEGARFSVTNADTSFHTDNAFGMSVLDYVGLLCLQTARSGGVNQVVSAYSALAALAREKPDALEILRRTFHFDRRGGVREGEAPTTEAQIVEARGGEVLVRYLRYWIHAGHEKTGRPLTREQVAALDAFDAVLRRPELRAELTLQHGEMFFVNNRWILHSRTGFEDHPEPERRRHLVRLWLEAEPE
jgi:alpha-ketoglutarate-dependent taurine dioxygenase